MYTARLPTGGLYSDGKKCPTLTRVTNCVPVQVRGARGRGSKKTVETTSIKKLQTEHFTCVSHPNKHIEILNFGKLHTLFSWIQDTDIMSKSISEFMWKCLN